MRHAQVCLCASTDQESIFHHSGGPVKLMQACLCAKNTLQHLFNCQGGAVKRVLACLSASKNEESSFHYCGSPVKVQVLFMGGKHITTAFKPPRGSCQARAGLFKFQ